MRNKTRRLAVVLLTLMLALSIAACGNSPGNSGNPTDGNTPETADLTDNASAQPPAAAQAEPSDASGAEPPAAAPDSASSQSASDLTLDALKQAAEAAGYTVSDGMGYAQGDGVPTPSAGFSFEYPDLTMSVCVLEFGSEADAKIYLDFMQGNESSKNRLHMKGRYILEIPVSFFDDSFTDEKDGALTKAIFG